MKPASIIVILLLWSASVAAHPLHLSITNITYENGKLKVSMKTFVDDWETAYFHFHSKVIEFSDADQLEIPWFSDYLDQHFKISLEKGAERYLMAIDTIVIDDDSMTIEMIAELHENPNSLYIYNSLLTDIFPDQTNLVIFGFNNKETGMKFDVLNHDKVVSL
jgi:hypothetical protein